MMSDRFYIGFSHDITAAVLVLPDNEKVAAVVYQTNRPFPSCPLPLCQNESPCESNRDFKIQDATASRTGWLINGLGLERRRLRGKSKVKIPVWM